MKDKIKKIRNLVLASASFLMYPFIALQTVYAQSDPSAEISAIIERIVTLATRVGSGVFILFIIKDAFDMLNNKDNPQYRGVLARDIVLFLIAALFLFKPDFILDAIKFIANV
ncbi:MAG: hypothetical protein QY330_05435 [Candidatus Dojkabacteria bacterium]|jgi:hypothetical protein|nr:MAG: hypothetical protein QY330_05435 [Candidatus Dojkabacteria bacterium]